VTFTPTRSIVPAKLRPGLSALGFAQQEASLPFQAGEVTPEVVEMFVKQMSPEEYPYLTEFANEHVLKPGYDFGLEFDFGLELILDGLERIYESS
jgi:hypothetical protein